MQVRALPLQPPREPPCRYELSGVWHEDRGEDGCSAATPVGCRVLRQLRSLGGAGGAGGEGGEGGEGGVEVVRAGYSVVAPRGWVRPHFGASNGVLKLHLGLEVTAA